MRKVIKLDKAKEKPPAKPNKHYKLSDASKYPYAYNLQECIRLYLVQPGEYPDIEELENMPVYQARKIMKKLNGLFDEKAEKRLVGLTGKTYMQEAVEKLDKALFGDEKKSEEKSKKKKTGPVIPLHPRDF